MKKYKYLKIQQIVKYLNNEMSPKELEVFKNWLKDSKNIALFKQYIVVNHYLELNNTSFDHKKAYVSFIDNRANNQKIPHIIVLWYKKILPYTKYAAIFIGAVLLTLSFNNKEEALGTIGAIDQITLQLDGGNIKNIDENISQKILDDNGKIIGEQRNNKLLYNYPTDGKKSKKTTLNILKVPRGKRFEVVLSDGTQVYLNSGSTLRYPVQFVRGKTRVVELTGEAYFKVAKNKEDSFIVNTSTVNTSVFGTEFNVSAYEDDIYTEVVLVNGSIGVYKKGSYFNKKSGTYLSPNQKATYSKTYSNIQVSKVKTQKYIAWVDGVLIFDNESFKTIVKKLERFYNLTITNNYTNLDSEKFTGQFDIETIKDVLNTFNNNTPFKFTIKNNKIIINPIKSLMVE